MLGTLLNNIAGYFSKYFFATAYLPILIFGLLNGFLADYFIEPFHDWIREQLSQSDSLTKSAFGTAVVALVTLVIAFAYSGLLDWLRRLLEGHWWGWLRRLFLPLHDGRRRRLLDRIASVTKERDKLADAATWAGDVRAAQKDSKNAAKTLAKSDAGYVSLAAWISDAETNQVRDRRPAPEDMKVQFNNLATLYKNNRDPDLMLGALNSRLTGTLERARRASDAEHMRLINELQSSFGDELAPTRMGNIANAMQAYAVRRYNCNLELFWTSLQVCIGAPTKDVLQDSKAKLDFMVASVWLAIATTALWLPLLYMGGVYVGWFVAFAIAAPLLCWIGYLAAVEQYRAFADVVTTGIDLYRFDLLRALKVAIPGDLQDERELWDELNCLASSNLELCARQNIRYALART